jgi:hypothetical protein
VPLLAGVVSLLLGDALQDRFAELTRQLVDRGASACWPPSAELPPGRRV